ncbi:hypothetical protein R6Z07F_017912 [Ovis aries]
MRPVPPCSPAPNSRCPRTPACPVALSARSSPGRRPGDLLPRSRLLEGRSPTRPGLPEDGGAFMRPPHPSSHRHRRRRLRAPRAAPQPQQGTQLWKSRDAPRGGRVRTVAPTRAPPAPPRLGEARESVFASEMSWEREGADPERLKRADRVRFAGAGPMGR